MAIGYFFFCEISLDWNKIKDDRKRDTYAKCMQTLGSQVMRECSLIRLQYALQALFKPQEKRENGLLRLISILVYH